MYWMQPIGSAIGPANVTFPFKYLTKLIFTAYFYGHIDYTAQ